MAIHRQLKNGPADLYADLASPARAGWGGGQNGWADECRGWPPDPARPATEGRGAWEPYICICLQYADIYAVVLMNPETELPDAIHVNSGGLPRCLLRRTQNTRVGFIAAPKGV